MSWAIVNRSFDPSRKPDSGAEKPCAASERQRAFSGAGARRIGPGAESTSFPDMGCRNTAAHREQSLTRSVNGRQINCKDELETKNNRPENRKTASRSERKPIDLALVTSRLLFILLQQNAAATGL